jgi:hypothetical protein
MASGLCLSMAVTLVKSSQFPNPPCSLKVNSPRTPITYNFLQTLRQRWIGVDV